jgi:hypothetical protein
MATLQMLQEQAGQFDHIAQEEEGTQALLERLAQMEEMETLVHLKNVVKAAGWRFLARMRQQRWQWRAGGCRAVVAAGVGAKITGAGGGDGGSGGGGMILIIEHL